MMLQRRRWHASRTLHSTKSKCTDLSPSQHLFGVPDANVPTRARSAQCIEGQEYAPLLPLFTSGCFRNSTSTSPFALHDKKRSAPPPQNRFFFLLLLVRCNLCSSAQSAYLGWRCGKKRRRALPFRYQS
jgi:hypothetical protein